MPRIAGVDIPNNKHIAVALTYIYGIGDITAGKLLAELRIDPIKIAKDLTDDELSRLASLLEKKYVIEGQLRRQEAQNIVRLKKIGCYRGIRHGRGLPVRGQRTRTNARTRKGRKRSVAVKRSIKAQH